MSRRRCGAEHAARHAPPPLTARHPAAGIPQSTADVAVVPALVALADLALTLWQLATH
uniref:Uncharacterized protein n=1 Tax=Streptomyces sp. NBC_00003 TaxID=2903608 RepID=A0AAU2V3W1_9ACTN